MEKKAEKFIPERKKRIKTVAPKLECPMCNSENIIFEAEVEGYTFEHCLNCALVFCPKITTEFLSGLYFDGFHGPEDGAPKSGWSKSVEFLEPAFKRLPQSRGLKILDFGTGQNRMPEVLRKQGHRVIAVDIVPPLRPHPDRLTGDIMDLELQKEQFDLIFSFQVFEHLPKPRPILFELLKLLKPGGLLLIHTDMETPEREEEGFKHWWYATPPDHCTFYRNKSFAIFIEDQPAEITYKDPKTVIIRKNGRLK